MFQQQRPPLVNTCWSTEYVLLYRICPDRSPFSSSMYNVCYWDLHKWNWTWCCIIVYKLNWCFKKYHSPLRYTVLRFQLQYAFIRWDGVVSCMCIHRVYTAEHHQSNIAQAYILRIGLAQQHLGCSPRGYLTKCLLWSLSMWTWSYRKWPLKGPHHNT